MYACVLLPLIWQQKEPKFQDQDQDEDWDGDSSSSNRSSGRKKRLTDLVADHDEYRCVVRGTSMLLTSTPISYSLIGTQMPPKPPLVLGDVQILLDKR